jgi:hypothetical protein
MASIDRTWLLGLLALVGSVGCGAEGIAEDEPVDQAEQQLDMNRFKGWQALPTGIFLGPPAVLNVDGNLNAVDVYGQGSDKAIWFARRTSATAPWVGWGRLDKEMKSKPAATMFGSNRAVVATGTDDNVWIRITEDGSTTFKAWERIPDGEFVGAPAIAYMSPYLFVMARKSTGEFFWTRNDVSTGLDNGDWTAWLLLGCCASTELALTASSNRIIFAARAADNRIWFAGTGDVGESWLDPKAVGTKTFQGAPAVSWHNGAVEVTGRDGDNLIWVASANGATGATDGWKQVPGGLVAASGPGTAANKSGTGRFAVATRRSDQTYAINFWE